MVDGLRNLCVGMNREKDLKLGIRLSNRQIKKTKVIQEKMRASQIRQKSYHDKCRKALEFQEGEHVFLKVTLITVVGRDLKSRNVTLSFIGPYQILQMIRKMAYQIALPLSLANLHDVFHCIS